MQSPVAWPRATIQRPVHYCGLGVTTARAITVSLLPSHEGGIKFRRSDTATEVVLQPGVASVGPSWTTIGTEAGEVRLVEHLLATLAAHAITDLLIEVSGPEVPLADGSARVWHELLLQAGRQSLPAEIPSLPVRAPLAVADQNGGVLCAFPWPTWRLLYTLEWPHPLVGRQRASFEVGQPDFGAALAPARTFALAEEARAAQQAGLFPAGSEDNVLVVFSDRLSAEPGLPEAFARHKLLDLLGDLYLAGQPLCGLFLGYNSGHRLNHRLLRRLLEQTQSAEPGP
jgi:UDP-3-O-acyl N-acetylglucosamine deacetylase